MRDFERGVHIIGSDWPANRLLASAGAVLNDFGKMPSLPREIIIADRYGRIVPNKKRIKFRRPRMFADAPV